MVWTSSFVNVLRWRTRMRSCWRNSWKSQGITCARIVGLKVSAFRKKRISRPSRTSETYTTSRRAILTSQQTSYHATSLTSGMFVFIAIFDITIVEREMEWNRSARDVVSYCRDRDCTRREIACRLQSNSKHLVLSADSQRWIFPLILSLPPSLSIFHAYTTTCIAIRSQVIDATSLRFQIRIGRLTT